MAFPYKHVTLIGATSGIGAAMADCLVQAGAKVTAVGRRKDRLDEFVSRHGETKARAVTFDVARLDRINQFVADTMQVSPDIDCIFLNAGVQRRYDFSQPENLDLASFKSEMEVNFISFVALTHAFLPFLMKQKSETSIIFTSSNLAIVPASNIPAYSASKAALNAFVLCLRDQLRNTSVKVIEISPPPVQTELHDTEMGVEAGRQFGMPLDAFTDQAFKGLVAGRDQIVIGSIGPADTFNEIVDKRRAAFEVLAKMLRGGS